MRFDEPLPGRRTGRITVVGYLGIALGILMLVLPIIIAPPNEPGSAALVMGMGLAFIVASYLYARR